MTLSFRPFMQFMLKTIVATALLLPVVPIVQFQSSGVALKILPEQSAIAGPTTEMARLKKTNKRWIEVNLRTQRLIAWEGKTWVDAKVISSGKASTPTLTGVFEIQDKYRTTVMRGADYEVPDVPHAMFYDGGYAIHGAYWHNSFGTPVSHGCVNMSENGAAWLFGWARVGTPVVIHR